MQTTGDGPLGCDVPKQKAAHVAARATGREEVADDGINKPVGPHTFRHFFATPATGYASADLPENAYDTWTVQELLGHKTAQA